MSKLIPPIPGFHRHIPSLQAHAALSAKPLFDPASCRSRDEMDTCKAVRGRLSESLLDWIDDLFGPKPKIPVSRDIGQMADAAFNGCDRDDITTFAIDHVDCTNPNGVRQAFLSLGMRRPLTASAPIHSRSAPTITRLFSRLRRAYGPESEYVIEIIEWVFTTFPPGPWHAVHTGRV